MYHNEDMMKVVDHIDMDTCYTFDHCCQIHSRMLYTNHQIVINYHCCTFYIRSDQPSGICIIL